MSDALAGIVSVEMEDYNNLSPHLKGKKEKKKFSSSQERFLVDSDEYFGGKGLSAHADHDKDDEIVRVDNVHKTYLLGIEGIAALRGVSMSLRRGEFVCIFGTSGGGKTR
jgi:ABC-type glutathione transport system ATPase component